MTLLSTLRCAEGAIITTDSRETSGTSGGRVAQDVTKLWTPRPGFLFAWAGFENVTQAFALAVQREKGLTPSVDRLEIEKRFLNLLKQIREAGKTDYAEWLIAWWSVPDSMPVALRLTSTGTTVWTEGWQHAGDERPINIARQITGSLRFVPRETLTVEQAKVLALKVMRDTIHVGVESIGGEPQIGAVTRKGVEIVTGADLRGLHDTLDVWEVQCAELLPGGVKVPSESTTPDPGIRPPGDSAAG